MPATRVDGIMAENFVENDLGIVSLIGNSKFPRSFFKVEIHFSLKENSDTGYMLFSILR